MDKIITDLEIQKLEEDIKKININSNDKFENINYTYVLLLNNFNFYIGHTTDIVERLCNHYCYSEKSSKWVIKNKPIIAIYEIIKNSKKEDEKYKTLELMKKFGWKNVRGYAWCQNKIKKEPLLLQYFKYDRVDFEYMSSNEIREIFNKVKNKLKE